MRGQNILMAGGVIAASLMTATGLPAQVQTRGKADIVKSLLEVIGVFTEDKATQAWDFQANKQMCEVFMKTVDGGQCTVSVECQDGGKAQYGDWNVCYVGGRQFFTDPRIGEFSVTFTQKDGDEGEGLTNPILQVKNIENFREWPVTDLAAEYNKANDCEAGMTPLNCHQGPWVCRWVEGGNTPIFDDRSKRWSCGVPVLGATFPEDISWEDIWGA